MGAPPTRAGRLAALRLLAGRVAMPVPVADADADSPWNWERYDQASEEARDELERSNTGFHSVGSRSDLAVWDVVGILIEGMRVGVIWGTIVRGERGGEVGGVVVIFEEVDIDIEGRDAESGLQESLRRQLEREREG
jgi:hypothetical protein